MVGQLAVAGVLLGVGSPHRLEGRSITLTLGALPCKPVTSLCVCKDTVRWGKGHQRWGIHMCLAQLSLVWAYS